MRVAYSHRSVNRLTRANWIKMDQNGRLLLNVTKMQQILERKENRDRTFCDLRFDGLGIGKWQGGAVWAYLRGLRRVYGLFRCRLGAKYIQNTTAPRIPDQNRM